MSDDEDVVLLNRRQAADSSAVPEMLGPEASMQASMSKKKSRKKKSKKKRDEDEEAAEDDQLGEGEGQEEKKKEEEPSGEPQEEFVVYDPPMEFLPSWVRRYNDLRMLYEQLQKDTFSVSESVQASVQESLVETKKLFQEVSYGREGGLFEQSSSRIEEFEEGDKDVGPNVPFWRYKKTAVATVEELLKGFELKQQQFGSLPFAYGQAPLSGLDGAHVTEVPRFVDVTRKLAFQRTVMADLFSYHPSFPPMSETFAKEYNKIPYLHDEFVVDDVDPAPEMNLLRDADMHLEGAAGNPEAALQRVVTLSVNFFRFQDHVAFEKENTYVASLLSSYERYRLLQSNLHEGLKSRQWYERLLATVRESAYKERLRDLRQQSVEIEMQCMRHMIKMWSKLASFREKKRAEQGDAAVNSDVLASFKFSLRRFGSNEDAIYQEGSDNILDFFPVVSYSDLNPNGRNPQFTVKLFVRNSPTSVPKFVAATESRALDCTFSVHFNETFEMRTVHDPSELQLQILDAGGTIVSTIVVPPSVCHRAVVLPFSTGQTFSFPDGSTCETNGIISLATTWTTSSGMTIDKIEKLFLDGEADPMDPKNRHLVLALKQYYKELHEETPEGKDVESAASALQKTSVVPQPMQLQDYRLEVLNRRWLLDSGEECPREDYETLLLDTAIPPDAGQTARMVRDLKQTAKQEPVTARRTVQHLEQWQLRVRNLKLTRRRAKHDDHEILAKHMVLPPVPTITRFFGKVWSHFAPKRSLMPKRKDRPEAEEIERAKLAEKKGSSQIVVHVLKIRSLPLRANGTPLNPFVEVSFVDEFSQTRCEAGPDPTYFETLSLDFCPLDFEEETLSVIDDDIIVSVYDQIQVDLPNTNMSHGAAANITHFRTERRLLGQVKLPFYTLYQSAKANVEGLFAINCPRIIAGYNRQPEPMANLYFSLWPPLSKKPDEPMTNQELQWRISMLPCTQELMWMHKRAAEWRHEAHLRINAIVRDNPLADRREIEPFVSNSGGDPTFVCRYILPNGCEPPEGLTTLPAVVRFVSMIPFLVDMLAWNDRKDVWSTNAEYLEMCAGDYEEMAILLVHLIRYVAPAGETYLITGEGDIYKQATYVLHYFNDECNIIDPRTGNIFPVESQRSGLSEVGLIISHNQVWANIQASGAPHRMVWRLDDERHWLPMFKVTKEANYLACLDYVQRAKLEYGPPSTRAARNIEDQLKRTVKRYLKGWRNNTTPVYQERVGTILREVLIKLEQERITFANYSQPNVDEAVLQAFEEAGTEFNFVGAPVNTHYTDEKFELMLNRVYETAVHEIGTDDVRFALGVYVHPFTSNVYSMWVFLVGLVSAEQAGSRYSRLLNTNTE